MDAPSAQLSPKNEDGCLADYPSEFALGAFAGLLGFLFTDFFSSFRVWFKRDSGLNREQNHGLTARIPL